MGWEAFWHAVTGRRVIASYKITFGAAFFAALTNAFFGLPFVVRTL